MFSKELQQTFFKEVMSLFQDLVDQQTDKLTTDTGKVNGRKAETKLYYLCQYSFDSSWILIYFTSRTLQNSQKSER